MIRRPDEPAAASSAVSPVPSWLRTVYRALPLPPAQKFALRVVGSRATRLVAAARDPLPPAPPSRETRFRVLVIGQTLPDPRHDAGAVRMVNLMKGLIDLGGAVSFADCTSLSGRWPVAARLAGEGIGCIDAAPLTAVPSLVTDASPPYDLVILERAPVAARYLAPLKRACPDLPVIFDTQDVHHIRFARHAEIAGSRRLRRDADAMRRMERDAISAADLTWVVSTYERDQVAALCPDAALDVLPLIVEPDPLPTPFPSRAGLLFIGGFQHAPNHDAVHHFVRDIWPDIAAALPKATFSIVGSDPPADIRALGGDRVRVLGHVEDLTPLLSAARLSVAPLRFGAGVKGKIATSLAHGLPCVASPVAVEGSGLACGTDILCAETERDFARAVVNLYTDESLWTRLSGAGVDFVARTYSMAAIAPRLESALRRLRVIA